MNPLKTWDFTSFISEEVSGMGVTSEGYKFYIQTVQTLLNTICDDWVFQLEECGETGRLHLQGRLKLKTKQRFSALQKKLHFEDSPLYGVHLSQTSKANVGNDFYVTKEETRVKGPYYKNPDKAPKTAEELERYHQLKGVTLETLRPWQLKLHKILLLSDARAINCLIDLVGGVGKSTFCLYETLCVPGTVWCPPLDSFKDVCQFVCSRVESIGASNVKRIIIDFPRSIRQNKVYEFMAGLELMKNGILYDTRYSAKQVTIPSPAILLFMNTIPEPTYVSLDRWRFFTVVKEDLERVPISLRGDPETVKRRIYGWLNKYANLIPTKEDERALDLSQLNDLEDILGKVEICDDDFNEPETEEERAKREAATNYKPSPLPFKKPEYIEIPFTFDDEVSGPTIKSVMK